MPSDDWPVLELCIEDASGRIHGPFKGTDRDPTFFVTNFGPVGSLVLKRLSKILLQKPNGTEERTMVGLNDTSQGNLQIIAPRMVKKFKSDAPYLKYKDGEVRPGAVVLGGRNTAFFDNYGVTLEACPTGGDPARFEDWAYLVAAPLFSGWPPTRQWILVDDIGPGIQGPEFIIPLATTTDVVVDAALGCADRELIHHVATHPDSISKLSPERFEELVDAIYRNNGFVTERVGAWNQPDGGVDILAVSKSGGVGDVTLAIQCRTAKNKVDARVIRELAGVLDGQRAHKGIVATSAKFTSSAREEAEGNLWRVSLQDKDDLYLRVLEILRPDIPKGKS